jgi:hypothetical protein
MIKFRVFGKQDTVEEFCERYKPKNHRKVVLGQLLKGALSRVPKSLHCNYESFHMDMSNYFWLFLDNHSILIQQDRI